MVVSMECETDVAVVYRDFEGQWVGEEKIAWAGTAVQSCLSVRNIGITSVDCSSNADDGCFQLTGTGRKRAKCSGRLVCAYLPKGGV